MGDFIAERVQTAIETEDGDKSMMEIAMS